MVVVKNSFTHLKVLKNYTDVLFLSTINKQGGNGYLMEAIENEIGAKVAMKLIKAHSQLVFTIFITQPRYSITLYV